jgi:hypothetical protein
VEKLSRYRETCGIQPTRLAVNNGCSGHHCIDVAQNFVRKKTTSDRWVIMMQYGPVLHCFGALVGG